MTETAERLGEETRTGSSPHGLGRRSFLKWSSAVAGGSALVGAGVQFVGMPGATPGLAHAAGDGMSDADRTVWSACIVNCGSRCPLRLQVKNGQIARVLPDNTGDDTLMNRQIRACVRGRNMRERVYSPDRIKKPLRRRPGTKRGEGKWDEISWDEAYDLFAKELKRCIDTYGNESVFRLYGSGIWNAHLATGGIWLRLFNLLGGSLNYYSNYSFSQVGSITKYHYGAPAEQMSNSFEDSIANGRMLVLWGNNPQETRMSGGGNTFTSLEAARKAGLKIVVIDPRHSDSVAVLADDWLAPRPGTDAALVAGVVHHLVASNLHDQAFLDKYCIGFDEAHMPPGVPENMSYLAYIQGKGYDKVEKTPEWAADVTGIPAQKIKDFAIDLGTSKPVNITQGWGPQRHANGENQCRAIYTLANVLGQVGIPGGGTGGREGYYWPLTASFPSGTNPVKASVSNFNWLQAIDHGPEMTATKDGIRGVDRLKTGIKFMVSFGSNIMASQHGDINATKKILTDESKCEFIVSIDNQFTRSCELSDLVLPDTTTAERWDLVPNEYCGDMAYLIMCEKAIEPLFESRSAYDVAADIAERFGLREKYTEGRTIEQWARYLHEEKNRKAVPDMPSFDDMKSKGVHRYYDPKGLTVALREFREDPEGQKLKTPSGKIEIFSAQLHEMSKTWEFPEKRKGDKITPIAEHIDTWEGAMEARTNKDFPIQLIGHHFKGRTHSTYGNLPRNREAHHQRVWINTADAQKRGIKNDDLVEIYNNRGRARIPAYVTPRIMPGVASLPQGAWTQIDAEGIDHGGSNNMLTTINPTPLAKGNCPHTTLVQIKKA